MDLVYYYFNLKAIAVSTEIYHFWQLVMKYYPIALLRKQHAEEIMGDYENELRCNRTDIHDYTNGREKLRVNNL